MQREGFWEIWDWLDRETPLIEMALSVIAVMAALVIIAVLLFIFGRLCIFGSWLVSATMWSISFGWYSVAGLNLLSGGAVSGYIIWKERPQLLKAGTN